MQQIDREDKGEGVDEVKDENDGKDQNQGEDDALRF